MGTIKCTAKLLGELRTEPTIIPSQPPSLSDWHANLLRIDRKKFVLFSNDPTLYSFVIRFVRKPPLLDFVEQFRMGLLRSLMSEGLGVSHAAQMLDSRGTIVITKTNSRSVLGSMNDLAFQSKYLVHPVGGLTNTNISEINRNINRIPMKAIKYNVAIEELKRWIVEPESGTINPWSQT